MKHGVYNDYMNCTFATMARMYPGSISQRNEASSQKYGMLTDNCNWKEHKHKRSAHLVSIAQQRDHDGENNRRNVGWD